MGCKLVENLLKFFSWIWCWKRKLWKDLVSPKRRGPTYDRNHLTPSAITQHNQTRIWYHAHTSLHSPRSWPNYCTPDPHSHKHEHTTRHKHSNFQPLVLLAHTRVSTRKHIHSSFAK
jgi:hypothetical protein